LFSSRDRVLFYFMLNNQKSDASVIQVFNSPQFGEIRTAGTSEEPLLAQFENLGELVKNTIFVA